MKKITKIIFSLILILSVSCTCAAETSPHAYMEITTTGPWNIFTKDMKDQNLLDAAGKSAEEINEILKQTESESLIINSETGANVYVKVLENDFANNMWNISYIDDADILENLREFVYDGFEADGLNYQDENVSIEDYAYMKFITVPGNCYYNGKIHGVVLGGSFVNGRAVVFTMVTEDEITEEKDIEAVKDIAKGVSFTVIKDKTAEEKAEGTNEEKDVFHYILGGFGALVIIIFCAYMIVSMKNKSEEQEKPEEEKKEDENKENTQ